MYKLQEKEWDPIINWFQKRFQVNLSKSLSIEGPTVDEETKNTLQKHLLSYNFDSLIGSYYCIWLNYNIVD